MFLKQAQPGSHSQISGHETFTWNGNVQPTPLNEIYKIRIRYKLGCYPEVIVKEPKLQGRDGQLIPHMYEQKRLCLFNPHKLEWNTRMRIADTILPWTSLWLYYYEIWLATGQWLGGGDHPTPTPERNQQCLSA
jgi:hypothetical protein